MPVSLASDNSYTVVFLSYIVVLKNGASSNGILSLLSNRYILVNSHSYHCLASASPCFFLPTTPSSQG